MDPKPAEPEPALNVRETAQELGVHENTVRNLERKGQLKAIRLPGSGFRRFKREDVERMQAEMFSQFAPDTEAPPERPDMPKREESLMDLSKPGPLYEAIRNHLGVDDRLNGHGKVIGKQDEIITKHGQRLRDLEQDAGRRDDVSRRLEVLEGTVKGLEHRTNHQTVEDRLNAMEERLEKMPKPRSRAKPKPRSLRASPRRRRGRDDASRHKRHPPLVDAAALRCLLGRGLPRPGWHANGRRPRRTQQRARARLGRPAHPCPQRVRRSRLRRPNRGSEAMSERVCHYGELPIDGDRAIEAKTGNAWAHVTCWYDGGPFEREMLDAVVAWPDARGAEEAA